MHFYTQPKQDVTSFQVSGVIGKLWFLKPRDKFLCLGFLNGSLVGCLKMQSVVYTSSGESHVLLYNIKGICIYPTCKYKHVFASLKR